MNYRNLYSTGAITRGNEHIPSISKLHCALIGPYESASSESHGKVGDVTGYTRRCQLGGKQPWLY